MHAIQNKNELSLAGEERWYLVHTLTKGETKAELNLKAQGFRTFLPRILKTVRHARQFRTVSAPLFPRYLFVVISPTRDRWLSIRSTYGVYDLYTCQNRPVAVPRGIVEGLITRAAEANFLTNQFHKGQNVRIMSGPFSGIVGSLDRLDEKGRVQVLLEIMNATVPVEVDIFRLLPVA